MACKHLVHLAGNTAKFQNLDALNFQPHRIVYSFQAICEVEYHLLQVLSCLAFPFGGVDHSMFKLNHCMAAEEQRKKQCLLTASGVVEGQLQK